MAPNSVSVDKANILFIDDDPFILEHVSLILTDEGHSVMTAMDGREGLRSFEQSSSDVVITDIVMPLHNGLEVLETIKKSKPETPVIILSGEGGLEEVKSALTLGAYDYLTKREIYSDPERLIAAVYRAYEKLQLIRENEAYKNDLENKVQERTKELLKNKELMSKHIEISEKQKLEAFRKIQYSEKRYKTVIAKTPSGIATIGASSGRITALNSAFIEVLGFQSEKQLKHQSIFDNKIFFDSDFAGKVLSCSELQCEDRASRPYVGPDKKTRFIEYTLTPLQIDDFGFDAEVLLTVKDVTLEKEEKERLAKEALHDGLTGLIKHEKFGERLGEIISSAKKEKKSVGLAHIDLDDFGAINSKYKHHAASEVLKVVGQRIRNSIDHDKDLGFRVGGDEFAVVFTDYQSDSLESIVARLFRLISQSYSVNDGEHDHNIDCTFSIGVSTYSKDRNQTAEKLYKEADEAMYIAKESGKNRFVFYEVKDACYA